MKITNNLTLLLIEETSVWEGKGVTSKGPFILTFEFYGEEGVAYLSREFETMKYPGFEYIESIGGIHESFKDALNDNYGMIIAEVQKYVAKQEEE